MFNKFDIIIIFNEIYIKKENIKKFTFLYNIIYLNI